MNSKARTIFKVTGWLIVSLMLLFAAIIPLTYAWVQSSWGKSWIIHTVERVFSEQFDARLYIESMDGTIPTRIILNNVGVVYTEENQSDLDTLIHISKAEINLRFWDLIYGQVYINGLYLQNPHVNFAADKDSASILSKVFAREQRDPQNEEVISDQIRMYVPSLRIENGSVQISSALLAKSNLNQSIPAFYSSINAKLFLELLPNQRYLDIQELKVLLPEYPLSNLELTGQFFSDQRYAELNQFRLKTPKSNLSLSLSVDGLDFNKFDWQSQLEQASYKLSIQETSLSMSELSLVRPDIKLPESNLNLSCKAEGKLSLISLETCSINLDDSVLEWDGELNELMNKERLRYSVRVNRANVSKKLFDNIINDPDNPFLSVLSELEIQGIANGNLDSISVDLKTKTQSGSVNIVSNVLFQDIIKYSGKVTFVDLKLDQWPQLNMGNSNLNLSSEFEGEGFGVDAFLALKSDVRESTIRGIELQSASLDTRLNDRVLTLSSSIRSDAGSSNLTANVDFSKNIPSYSFDGKIDSINVSSLFTDLELPQTQLNASFSGNLKGSNLADLQGNFSFDGSPSVVNGDTITGIQSYADILKNGDVLQLRLTSTFIDAFITGSYDLQQLFYHSQYWFKSFKDQFNAEFLQSESGKSPSLVNAQNILPIRLEFNANLKQIELLNRFLKSNPVDQANSKLSGSILADNQRLLLDLSFSDPNFKINNTLFNKVDLKITTAFQANTSFGESTNIQLLSNIGSIQQGRITLENLTTKASILNDTLRLDQTIVGLGNAARASFNVEAALQDSVINVVFPNFFLGNNQYSWKASGLPSVRILPANKIEFVDFKFINGEERLNLSGILSEDLSDEIGLDITNLNLSKISDLLELRFDFAGNMNGSIVSRGLRSLANVEGHLFIDNVAIDGRTLGDITLDSQYNPETTVFDTNLRIVNDFDGEGEKESGQIISNNINLNGFIDLDTDDPSVDDVFNFEANFEEVNLWAVRYLLLDVFTSMEGKAYGKGRLRGNLKRLEFDSNFTVEEAKVSPVFLNTNYVLNGNLRFNDQEGIVFENISVRDDKRGTGILSGRVDMNDFKPVKNLDLNLRMNRLEFLNNRYDPDVPFYGVVSGSGEVRLSGPNTKPFVQTIRPITVTPNSKLTIPMLDETAINQQTNFIRFVNQFFERSNQPLIATEQKQTNVQERSFTDIFQLDLQFNMPQDAAIEFIFDPVTNEYLTTRGTGSVRMTLETGNLGMFGSFDIDRGEYNFVGGDIFTKKFKIRPGGTVIWDGLAQDPRIDVVAFFAARPNLAPLGTGRDIRVPIDLVLNLKGRLATIENDFYFAYPSNFDTDLSASELSILNSEAQKLLQATSLLITGNFLPVDTGANSDQNTQNRITQAGLGQLLSSQINNVLNSSLSNFDFDLNLTGFDQADLGIGLRLFDDRLELRRDGTIVGEQSNIGDLEATYRINRFLSVEIFHRQDINSNRRVSQNGSLDRVNGLGLQYQVQFSSWRRFFDDIWRFLTGKQS